MTFLLTGCLLHRSLQGPSRQYSGEVAPVTPPTRNGHRGTCPHRSVVRGRPASGVIVRLLARERLLGRDDTHRPLRGAGQATRRAASAVVRERKMHGNAADRPECCRMQEPFVRDSGALARRRDDDRGDDVAGAQATSVPHRCTGPSARDVPRPCGAGDLDSWRPAPVPAGGRVRLGRRRQVSTERRRDCVTCASPLSRRASASAGRVRLQSQSSAVIAASVVIAPILRLPSRAGLDASQRRESAAGRPAAFRRAGSGLGSTSSPCPPARTRAPGVLASSADGFVKAAGRGVSGGCHGLSPASRARSSPASRECRCA